MSKFGGEGDSLDPVFDNKIYLGTTDRAELIISAALVRAEDRHRTINIRNQWCKSDRLAFDRYILLFLFSILGNYELAVT
jgi:hypothetical protein